MDVDQLWDAVGKEKFPTPIVDVSHVFERISLEVRSKQTTAGYATKRAAWVFIGECNNVLPPSLMVRLKDDDHAIDEIDRALDALAQQARAWKCDIMHQGWVVWAGAPAVIREWKNKLQ